MHRSLGKLAHVAAAGAMVLGIGAFNGLNVGPQAADAREANAIAGTYKSAIVLANPGNVDTTALVTFVTSTGGAATSSPVSALVPAGGSTIVDVPNVAGLADGRYSVLIDSDQPITAVANVGSDDTKQFTSYNGITTAETGTTFYIPQAFKSYFGYTSNIIVQNAGSSTASVTVTYKDANGNTSGVDTQSIPAGASYTFDQSTSSGLQSLASFNGSAVVTSTQNVAALFLVSLDSAQYGKQLSSGRGAKSGATSVYLPGIYNNYYGNSSSVLVQNVGSTATTATITYYNANGTQAGQPEQAVIQPGTRATFLQFNTPSSTAAVPAGFNGSAVVTASSGGLITAAGNIQHLVKGRFESYNGFPGGSATNRVTCPSIFDNYYLNDTSMAIQNVGSAAADVTIAFNGTVGNTATSKTVTATIQPNSIYFAYTGAGFLGAGFHGSAVVTSATAGAQLVGVVNQETIPNPGDVLLTYDCVNS